MPYGIPKDAGGDSPENVAKMETCIKKVMKKGMEKDSAIRVCKVSMFSSRVEDILQAASVDVEAVGRMLSSKNIASLKQTVTILQDLISRAEGGNKPEAAGMALRLEGEGIVFEPEDETLGDGMLVIEDDGGIKFEGGERLGTYISRMRAKTNLTAEGVAEKTGVGPEAYMAIEKGYNSYPADDVLAEIAAALSCDLQHMKNLRAMDRERPVQSY